MWSMCSGSVVVTGNVVVTVYDVESIYYKALIIAQGSPEPSSLRGSTLGTRAAEHKGCNC